MSKKYCLFLFTLCWVWAQGNEIAWEKSREEAETYAKEIGAPVWYFFSDFDQRGNIWDGHLRKLEKKAADFMEGNKGMVFGAQTQIWSDKKIIEMSRYFVSVVAEATGTDAADYPGIKFCSIVFTDHEKNMMGKVIGGEIRTVGYFFKASEVVAEMEKSLQNLGMREPISWYEMMYAQQKEAERAMDAGEYDYAIAVLEDLKANAKKSCYVHRAQELIEQCKNPAPKKIAGEEKHVEEATKPPSEFESMLDESRDIYLENPEKAITLLKSILKDCKEAEITEEAAMMVEAILSEHPELKKLEPKTPEKNNKTPEKNTEETNNNPSNKNFTLPKPYSKKGEKTLEIVKVLYKRNLYQKALEGLNKILETESGTRIVWEVNLLKEKIKAVPQVHAALNSPKIKEEIQKLMEEAHKFVNEGDKKKAIKKLETIIDKYPDADDTKEAFKKIQELAS